MRNIEVAMLDAIRNRKDWRSSNTQTKHVADTDCTFVWLHNNLIAKVTPQFVEICDCGWQTPTTKSRLNAILRTLCGAGIYQKNHTWFGSAIEETDWEIEPNTQHVFVRG